MDWNIRLATPEDQPHIVDVIHEAFGEDEGQVISDLVKKLLEDHSARPTLSQVATHGDRIVGHILFTATHLKDVITEVRSSILAPLSVHPEYQKRGIGTQLIREGFEHLQNEGVGLVFVLGDPAYYQRHGFTAAGAHELEAPYTLPQEYLNAWMVKELQPDIIGSVNGVVTCANALDDSKYWIE